MRDLGHAWALDALQSLRWLWMLHRYANKWMRRKQFRQQCVTMSTPRRDKVRLLHDTAAPAEVHWLTRQDNREHQETPASFSTPPYLGKEPHPAVPYEEFIKRIESFTFVQVLDNRINRGSFQQGGGVSWTKEEFLLLGFVPIKVWEVWNKLVQFDHLNRR